MADPARLVFAGGALRWYRKEVRGDSLVYAASLAGVSSPAWFSWENGDRQPQCHAFLMLYCRLLPEAYATLMFKEAE